MLPDLAFFNEKDIYFFAKPYNPGENLLHFNGKRFSSISFSNRNSVIYGGAFAIKDSGGYDRISNNKGYLVKVKRIKVIEALRIPIQLKLLTQIKFSYLFIVCKFIAGPV